MTLRSNQFGSAEMDLLDVGKTITYSEQVLPPKGRLFLPNGKIINGESETIPETPQSTKQADLEDYNKQLLQLQNRKVLDPTAGHDHDGSNSKKVAFPNLLTRQHDHSSVNEGVNLVPQTVDAKYSIPSIKITTTGGGDKSVTMGRNVTGNESYFQNVITAVTDFTRKFISFKNSAVSGLKGLLSLGDETNYDGEIKMYGHITRMTNDTHIDGYIPVYRTALTPPRFHLENIPIPSTNLVRNGSFELDIITNVIRYWTLNGTATASRDNGSNIPRPDNFGSYCARFPMYAGNNVIASGNYYSQVYQNLKPNTIYTLTAWYKNDVHQGGVFFQDTRFIVVDSTGTLADSGALYETVWTKMLLTFITGNNGNGTCPDVTLKIGSTDTFEYFYVDSICLTEGGEKIYTPF